MSLRSEALALAFLLGFLGAPAKAQEIVPVKDVADVSPREPLRKKIFKDALDQRACLSVKVDPRGGLAGFDAELDSFVKIVIDSLKHSKAKQMMPLFHKGMNVQFSQVDEVFKKINSTYKEPLDVSVYRLWAFNTVDGSPKGVSCVDDRLTAYPLYGHPLQFGLWLQVMGQAELGRIYMSLIPDQNRWYIGSLHSQQWTHDGQDFASWTEEAVKAERMGFPMAAWAKYDLAAKLLDGGGFLDIAMRDEILAARDALMPRDTWEGNIKKALEGYNVAYAASMLVTGGVGILARISIPKELSLESMKSDCAKAARLLLKQDWHTQMVGVRCSYVLPGEDPKKEGGLGGLYIPFAEVKPQAGD